MPIFTYVRANMLIRESITVPMVQSVRGKTEHSNFLVWWKTIFGANLKLGFESLHDPILLSSTMIRWKPLRPFPTTINQFRGTKRKKEKEHKYKFKLVPYRTHTLQASTRRPTKAATVPQFH